MEKWRNEINLRKSELVRKFVFVVVFCCALSSFSQNKKEKKDIKTYRIKSITETVTEMKNGKEVTRKDSYTAYDKNANILQNEEYRKDGTLKRKETAKYDSHGNKVEETVFDAASQKDEPDNQSKPEKNVKHVCKYDTEDNKIEELEYDVTEKLIYRRQSSYNSKGDKILEVTFDANGKLIKKIIYIYDSKGLKVEKKEYDGENKIISVRKHHYVF